MGRPSKSKHQKQEREAARQRAQQAFGTVPHSFVFPRGRVGRNVRQLLTDVRKVMEPYTARALKVRKNNSLKDFVAVAGPLGVTHFLVFSKSSSSINFKLFRLPGGPTLTFKVMQYSLIKDVVSSLKRHRMHEQQFTHPPLLVLSNFGLQQIQLKLMATMFQNMFPSINVHRVNLNTIKRCLLISYDAETQLLNFRHYSVKVVPVGVSKGLKKLLQEKFPNMSRLGPCGNFSSFQESVWSVLVVQFLLALAGNGAAVYHFVSRRRSWHSGVIYSFHLALSGLLYSLTLPFLAAYYYPPKDWRYGAVLCKLERFLFHCNLYGSIFFVACISLNRYLGIVHPLRVHGRLRPRHAKALSAGVWVLAGVLSAPTLYFAELEEAEGVRKCLGSAALRRLRWFYPYSLLLAALGCALPFLLTAFCHAAVLRTVRHNPHLSQAEKRKVGLLVGAGVALYAFSYLPYHVFRNLNLWRRLLPPAAENCAVSSAIHATAQVCKILVNLNVCLHPLLYAALADTLQSCCGTGSTDEERAEHVELRPAAPQPPPGSPRQLVQPGGGL